MSNKQVWTRVYTLMSHLQRGVLMPKGPIGRSQVIAAFGGRRRRPRNDPSAGQTVEQIAAYYLSAKIGDRAAIKQTQNQLLRFTITEIENIDPKTGRLYVKQGAPDWGGSAFYRKTGKNCYSPRGQTSLVIPTTEISAWARKNPGGSTDWS
jgi:hypothetical protein